MIAIVDIKLFFLMSDDQLKWHMQHGTKDEHYAAWAEFQFRKVNGLLEPTEATLEKMVGV